MANDCCEIYIQENKKLSRKTKVLEQTLTQFNSIKTNYDVLINKLEEKDKNLREINEKLEEIVHERTKELEQINHQLKDNLKLLEELSITDTLTTLRNRRSFDEIFLQEFNRSKRQDYTFNFLIIDIDFFKKFNDTYGHAQGDEVLQIVGKILNRFARRSNDFAFRYGGEEFVYMSCFLNEDQLLELGNSIKDALLSEKIPHEQNPNQFVTASIGGVVSTSKTLLTQDIFKFADDNLYKSKANGRNLVTITRLE